MMLLTFQRSLCDGNTGKVLKRRISNPDPLTWAVGNLDKVKVGRIHPAFFLSTWLSKEKIVIELIFISPTNNFLVKIVLKNRYNWRNPLL